jgi:hypothetical protein
LTSAQADDDGAMIPKYPSEGGERNKAREAIDVRKTFDFCHADIVTEFRTIAISIFSGYFQGIRTLKNEIYPLKSAKSLKKNISVEKGEKLLFDKIVYFFYITNDWVHTVDAIVFSANNRCDQENLLAQLGGGVRALRAPVDNLESNWAYMVMTALAWNLKAWCALSLPEQPGRWQEKHRTEKSWLLRLEFKAFVNAFVYLPCQIIRTGRKLVYRLLGWNPYQPIFFRLVDVLRC